jgi:hypothetical protein
MPRPSNAEAGIRPRKPEAGRPFAGADKKAPGNGIRSDQPNRDPERNWRDLAGSSPSQVGVDGALRAREVARPTDQDRLEAEREVVVIKRNWQPPDGEGPPIHK